MGGWFSVGRLPVSGRVVRPVVKALVWSVALLLFMPPFWKPSFAFRSDAPQAALEAI